MTEPRQAAVFVTGAPGGLGLVIAAAFAQTGARVALLDIDGCCQTNQKSLGNRPNPRLVQAAQS